MHILKSRANPSIARFAGMRWVRLFGHKAEGQQWAKLKKRITLIALLLVASTSLASPDPSLQVSFKYSTGRNSVLIAARINEKPVLLILDTGSAHTILRPEVVGLDPKELMPPQTTS